MKVVKEDDPLDYIKEEDLFKNPEHMLWKVVKASFDGREEIQGHRLSKGDVVKIGRVRFKIREIVSPTYKLIEQKQKQLMKIYQQRVKKEFQTLLQEQLDSMRVERISAIEHRGVENETISHAEELNRLHTQTVTPIKLSKIDNEDKDKDEYGPAGEN
jgi:hypothetical protein